MTLKLLEDVLRYIVLALILIAIVILSFAKADVGTESMKTSCPIIESAVK